MKTENTCVAQFERLATEAYGGDAKVRIYKVDNGFVPCFYDASGYVSDGAECVTYSSAVAVAIEWLDNSDFHL